MPLSTEPAPGVMAMISATLEMPMASICSPVMAVIAIGTSICRSSRLRAVTRMPTMLSTVGMSAVRCTAAGATAPDGTGCGWMLTASAPSTL